MSEQNEIKSVSLKHCKDVLEREDPNREMEMMFEIRNRLDEERLKASDYEGLEANKEAFIKFYQRSSLTTNGAMNF